MGVWAGKVVIVRPGVDPGAMTGVLGVVVAGTDAAAVGAAVTRLGAHGLRASGFVGAPDDPAAHQMAAELFPGSEVVLGAVD